MVPGLEMERAVLGAAVQTPTVALKVYATPFGAA
jgi:hypothetical protein